MKTLRKIGISEEFEDDPEVKDLKKLPLEKSQPLNKETLDDSKLQNAMSALSPLKPKKLRACQSELASLTLKPIPKEDTNDFLSDSEFPSPIEEFPQEDRKWILIDESL